MAQQSSPHKTRRLRAAPQSMRERAAQSGTKPSKLRRLAVVGRPFNFLGKLKIWKPFAWLARHIVPPYLRNSFQELRQVTWPGRAQTFRLTRDVILFALVFGIIVGIFDFGLDKLFKQVILR